jgi:hypothetical protein
MSVLPKEVQRFNVVPSKPWCFCLLFMKVDKVILKCIWENSGPRMCRTLVKKTGRGDWLSRCQDVL